MLLKRLFITAILSLVFQSAALAQSNAAPQLVKQSLSIRTYRDTLYWKQPDTNNFWCWMPGLEFDVAGTIPDASFFNVEFTMPDGRPWFAVDVTPQATGREGFAHVVTPSPSTHLDKRNILDTGTFGVKVTLKNGLSGTNQEFFKGKFTVKKFHVGNNLPAFKNQFEYYVDQDWMLPIGYVFQDVQASALGAAMWFRGENEDKLEGYLFYNGKQIGSTKSGGSAYSDKKLLTSGNDTEPRWERWFFLFRGVPGGGAGKYEGKVLHDGELSRVVAFEIGADGQVVDNHIATQNNFPGPVNVVPVKIVDAKAAPPYNPNAYKTDAFYGNPLAGFTAIE